ncbi:site-specific DNA-methyltransferase [Ravibacter arvi]|uniref:site-specific DNA-methyltransferase (cytosine-N(4)-specific) n=1 Tax=Ravibacter arvi TaxID=2051041 RepID=A0ABP8LXP9_9BACT
MQNKLNNNFSLRDRGYSNYEDSSDLPRHRWYYYKEGFSPYLVEKAIEQVEIKKGDLILDPFNGSGTTTLTSSILGLQSVGIEVNPFTSFLSKVKVRNSQIDIIDSIEGKLFESTIKGTKSPLVGFSTFSQMDHLEKWLFNDSVLNSFEAGWQFSHSIDNRSTRELLQLALISSAMQNCNAKRDGKCLRYRSSWKSNGFDEYSFTESLVQNLSKIRSDIQADPIEIEPIIHSGDCRNILRQSNSVNNFKLCITSPPYLNTFDYTDIYRPELFLGKFIESKQALYNLRLETVRSHIQAKWVAPKRNNFGALYHQTMAYFNENKDKLMHKDILLMVQAYFEDIQNILTILRGKCAKNSEVWLVVSNSAYADLEVPVDLIIGDIASKCGWYLKEIGVLRYVKKRKTKHSPNVTDLRESVVILSSEKF